MKEISLEFGILIAYAIPGAMALLGVSYFNFIPDLHSLFERAATGSSISASLMLAGLSLIFGMVISVFRASIIDRSFKYPVPGLARRIEKEPDFGGILRVDPDYVALSNKDKLAAFQEAKGNDKRPYQFYGNMILAVLSFEAGRVASRPFSLSEVLIAGVLMIAFYFAARRSHYRFMSAVKALNESRAN